MGRRFHTYGYPIDLDRIEHLPHTWVSYGHAAEPERRAIASCPRCGEPLVTGVLRAAAPHPAAKLREWCLDWPDLRHTLDAATAARQQRESCIDGNQAETVLIEFEYRLRAVAELAAGLLVPIDAEPVADVAG